jgi:glycogen debranching enzyme
LAFKEQEKSVMGLEITIGPPHLALHQGYAVLITDPDGQIRRSSNRGLYFFDTRLISGWRLSVNGERWDLLNSGSIEHFAARIFLTNRRFRSENGYVEARRLSLVVSRSISGGVHEDIDLVNHGMTAARFDLEIAIRSDFADLFDVRADRVVPRGHIATQWSEARSQLTTIYRHEDFCRQLAVRVCRSGSQPVYANGRVTFPIDLPPGRSWHACLLYDLGQQDTLLEAPSACIAESGKSKAGERHAQWQNDVTKIHSSNKKFERLLRQAIEDMAALRLPVEEAANETHFMPAAGVPWFVALFGRDSLIASIESAIVDPGLACTTLERLASFQAKDCVDETDAEPGKIMHELRRGELAHFKLVPHRPYYGTADATILYLIVLHTAWRCIGDRGLLERHIETAERCLDWIDRYGDRDADGFQEYERRSPRGYENQGWKDSKDAVLYPDGSPVKGPKALCELQGYVFDAWRRMAEIFEVLDQPARARALRDKARNLFARFNEAFWDESAGFYAYALDGDKKKVLTIASNPGHCLWSGIVPRDRAATVARRLLAPDMSSGWGIRTLSAHHTAYNPYSYHNGSIWPHDNGLIALGFRRYGFAEEAARIIGDVSAAASYFMLQQIPELYAGVQREPTNFPVQYLGANVPQAWGAGSALAFLQALIGFQPDAPNDTLYLDPALPAWLPDLTLENLRVGARRFDLRFWNDGRKTRWAVLKGPSERVVERSFASGERLVSELAPAMSA